MDKRDWSTALRASERLSEPQKRAFLAACGLALHPVDHSQKNRFEYIDHTLRAATWEPSHGCVINSDVLRQMAYAKCRLQCVTGVASGMKMDDGFEKIAQEDFQRELDRLEKFVSAAEYKRGEFRKELYRLPSVANATVVVMATEDRADNCYLADVTCLFPEEGIKAAIQVGFSEAAHGLSKPYLSSHGIIPFSGQREHIARETPDGVCVRARRNDWGRRWMDFNETSFELEVCLGSGNSRMVVNEFAGEARSKIYLRGEHYAATA